MNHREATLLLADLADGALEDRQSADLEKHVADCESCREWLSTYQFLGAALAPVGSLRKSEHVSSELVAETATAAGDEFEHWSAAERDHLESCDSCRRDLALARAALSDRRVEPALAQPSHPIWKSSWKVAAAVLLVVGISGSLALRLNRPQPAAEDVLLAEQSLQGSQRIQAEGMVTATDVQVSQGARIVMQAGDVVAFGDGFEVASDADLVVISGGT
jgi:hypothetical protein